MLVEHCLNVTVYCGALFISLSRCAYSMVVKVSVKDLPHFRIRVKPDLIFITPGKIKKVLFILKYKKYMNQ